MAPLLMENTKPINLIVIDMKEFDVILGIDWLTTLGDTIDCPGRKVVCRASDRLEFIFMGSSIRVRESFQGSQVFLKIDRTFKPLSAKRLGLRTFL